MFYHRSGFVLDNPLDPDSGSIAFCKRSGFDSFLNPEPYFDYGSRFFN